MLRTVYTITQGVGDSLIPSQAPRATRADRLTPHEMRVGTETPAFPKQR